MTELPQNPTTSYVATDTLQSVRAISDKNGNVISRRDFMPFGEEIYANTANRTTGAKYSAAGDDGIRKKFTGYEKDKETGLDFAEARYYNNAHGRFTAVDPLLASGKSANPQTFNRYVYVMNSPLTLTDPTGLQAGMDLGFGYSVYFRTFAPFDWFGGFGTDAFMGDGRNRTFSPDLTGPNSSYRMSAVSTAKATNDGSEYKEVKTYAQQASYSYDRWRGLVSGTLAGNMLAGSMGVGYGASSECWIDEYNWQNYGEGAIYHMYGNDDAVIDVEYLNPAWDIDINVNWHAEYRPYTASQVIMNIYGGATGDGFPAAESFVYDRYGNGIMLGVYAVPPDTTGPEPEMRLAGDNIRPMFNFNVNIVVKNGVFQGVLENENLISIEDWNKRFTSKPTRQDDN